MSELRRFEKSDWYAYAGAEKFNGEKEPFILEFELDYNAEMCIIADRNGIEIHLSNGEGAEAWSKGVKLSSIRAEGELRAIEKALNGLTYAPDVAYAIDHPTAEALKGFDYDGELY